MASMCDVQGASRKQGRQGCQIALAGLALVAAFVGFVAAQRTSSFDTRRAIRPGGVLRSTVGLAHVDRARPSSAVSNPPRKTEVEPAGTGSTPRPPVVAFDPEGGEWAPAALSLAIECEGSAETDAGANSESTLLSILSDPRRSTADRREALREFGRLAAPSPAALEAIVRVLAVEQDPESAGDAVATLEWIAGASSSLEVRDRIVEELELRLGADSEDELAPRLVQAIARAAAPRSLPVLLGLASSADDEIREAAIRGLRALDGVDAAAAIERALATDPSERVRVAAAEAASELSDVETGRALASAAGNPSLPEAQKAAQAALIQRVAHDADARTAVEAVALLSPFEDLRDEAARTLAIAAR
ncbi:MAG: HEAT repeat domain-containing protein [Planctomycetes bacterium]|nr:HEAT repeat domain-containing protein [Planctomycetota bacterium]